MLVKPYIAFVLKNDHIIKNNSKNGRGNFRFCGTAEPGKTVVILDGNEQLTETKANESAWWEATIKFEELKKYSIKAKVMHGNTPVSEAFNFEVYEEPGP